MESTIEIRQVEVGQETLDNLNITRKWSMFLAILGFISVGMMILAGVTIIVLLPLFDDVTQFGAFEMAIIMGVMILFSVIYFFPILYLYRFSVHTKNAVQNYSSAELAAAMKNLKSCFVYLGVMAVVIISLYILMIVVASASLALFNAV